MSIQQIQRAAERLLATITPSIPTAYEGVSFTPPTSGLYQRVKFDIRQPDDDTIGTGFHREQLLLQVFIVGQPNQGRADILARAELIRDKFKKGTFLLEDGVRIHVLRTPQISGVGQSMVCPVLINLVAEVYS